MDIKATYEYTRNLTLLYVEDDELIRKEGFEMLDKFFKNVQTASDGEEGLALYRSSKKESGEYFDLVITDINMPRMNGIEMITEIKEENRSQPIIVISAHDETKYLIPLIRLGVDGFLLKPMDITMLTNLLYKTCQGINDHKMVTEYHGHIEELNLSLADKNRELETSIRQLEGLIYTEQVKDKQSKKSEPAVPKEIETGTFDQELFDLISLDLPELIDIYEDLDTIFANLSIQIRNSGEYDKDSFEQATVKLKRYAFKLSSYSTFHELSENMETLVKVLEVQDFPDDKVSLENIFMLIESFMLMVNRWHNEWKNGEAEKINFFYKSVISDIHTIVNVLQEPEGGEEEIEFF